MNWRVMCTGMVCTLVFELLPHPSRPLLITIWDSSWHFMRISFSISSSLSFCWSISSRRSWASCFWDSSSCRAAVSLSRSFCISYQVSPVLAQGWVHTELAEEEIPWPAPQHSSGGWPPPCLQCPVQAWTSLWHRQMGKKVNTKNHLRRYCHIIKNGIGCWNPQWVSEPGPDEQELHNSRKP